MYIYYCITATSLVITTMFLKIFAALYTNLSSNNKIDFILIQFSYIYFIVILLYHIHMLNVHYMKKLEVRVPHDVYWRRVSCNSGSEHINFSIRCDSSTNLRVPRFLFGIAIHFTYGLRDSLNQEFNCLFYTLHDI